MAETKLGKDAITLPVGTTAQRPANPEAGMMRFNTDEGYVEWYDDFGDRWIATSSFPGVVATGGTVTDIEQDGQLFRLHTFTSDGTFEVARRGEVEYLVVGGGGSGGTGGGGGGGGAGGVVIGDNPVGVGVYPVLVGAGGAAATEARQNGNSGDNSSIFEIVAFGGGFGSGRDTSESGGSGGSGGGGAYQGNVSGGIGTAGQGNDGGEASTSRSGNTRSGAGGGGASTAGQSSGSLSDGGDGGVGVDVSGLFGTSIGINGRLGGGGGGGHDVDNNPGIGVDGGGDGGTETARGGPLSQSGVDGTGGGGGGMWSTDLTTGGSGIVIVRYRIG